MVMHFDSQYTRRVGGENYSYTAQIASGEAPTWRADIFRDHKYKATLNGKLINSGLTRSALKQIVMATIESEIEVQLGIPE